MAYELHTEIDIGAPPLVVWEVLTDLAGFAEWNPFITSSHGELVVGKRLINRIEPPGGKPVTFKPTITEVAEPRVLVWLGRLGVPGLFDGRHRFELAPAGAGTRLVQAERFTGVLVPMFTKRLGNHTRAGFEAMNVALKARAEALNEQTDGR